MHNSKSLAISSSTLAAILLAVTIASQLPAIPH
jgi:hypothetical protein